MTAAQPILDRRSLGLKFLLVCLLAVLMSIPALGVFSLIHDRTSRVRTVVEEVGQRLGGEQTVVGPLLVAPYRQTTTVYVEGRQQQQVSEGWYAVLAEQGGAHAQLQTNVQSRGDLFRVRAYTADVAVNASFDLEGEPSAAPQGAVIDWGRAVILVGVADTRGVIEAESLSIEGRPDAPFRPGSGYASVFPMLNGMQSNYGVEARGVSPSRPVQWLVADVASLARAGETIVVSTRLRLTGVESFSLTAFARNTELRMQGNLRFESGGRTAWTDVGYYGAFARHGDDAPHGAAAAAGRAERFDARWSIPSVRQNLAHAGPTQDLARLSELAVTARFLDPANPYQAVTRSLKYALLFIGVVFLAYFLFEATSERSVHPAQYVLVGLAQIVFYLLLLALAERVGFDWAFLAAAGATVALIGWYAGAVFHSRQRALAAVAAFSLLYALIYVLMTLDDYALLVGAVAAFAAIASVMYFTRNLDWYGLSRKGAAPPAAAPD